MSVADVLLSRKSEMRREIRDFQISAPPKYIYDVLRARKHQKVEIKTLVRLEPREGSQKVF